ncbi:MFS transporter [Amycolatopsis sp. 195334CR]|uniref:MFS transporter n=1 Tax=Amycolatopsis sp. 195334CR TaxID=2814588 RepID=UPI001A8F9F2C|nr:MFS transporter [Amycolatopsis sp. 195334CR]MBN6036639.1 MFS transporter [Amycolatopsis sp. 195334CR]
MVPTLVVIALGGFVTSLDNNIVAAGVPSMARELGLGLGELQWVSIGYMLPFAALLLVAGLLVDRLGQARTLVGGLIGFGIGAVAGGFATTGWVLIGARVLQGTAAAFMVPGLLSLLRTNLNSRQRAVGATLWTASLAVALAVGPTVGGLLSEYLHWGWIFFSNLPFVAAIALLVPATAGGRRHRGGRIHLRPMFQAFWQRVFVSGLLVQILWGLGVSGVFFFTPLLHQESLGLTPLLAGLPLVLVALAIMAATPAVPWSVTRFGPHWTVAVGLTGVAAGLVAVALVNHIPEIPPRIPGLLLIGAGSALTTPLTSFALEVVPGEHAGMASGLLTASRELSGAAGVALIGVVLTSVRATHLQLGEGPALATGYTAGLYTAAGLELAGAALALAVFRRRE